MHTKQLPHTIPRTMLSAMPFPQSKLRNPDRELTLLARRGDIDRERLAWMAEQMRPMTRLISVLLARRTIDLRWVTPGCST